MSNYTVRNRLAIALVLAATGAAAAQQVPRLEPQTRMRSLDGTYRFGHLVPGDYFIAAVDERRMHDWPRPGFLETIAKQASPVRIVPGEPRTLKLTLQAR